MTFIAALRLDGMEAPWLIKGPINGERFRIYVEKVLIPTLKPRDIVVMDNLGSHMSKAVREDIGKILQTVTPRECSNYLENAEYGQT